MKKFLTLSTILKFCAAVLGLVAFCLMFSKQLYLEILGKKGFVDFGDALFDKDYGAAISFIGYLLILLASLGFCATIFLKNKKMKLIAGCLALALILGAVFVFIESAVVNNKAGGSAYHLAAGPVLAGIFAILAALAGCASEFLKK